MRKKRIIEIGIVIAAVGIVLGIGYQKQNRARQIEEQIAAEPKTEQVGEARSLDGKMKLTLERTVNKVDQTQIYSFSVSDMPSPIFTKTMGLSGSMAIPANSWSPENKYVFVEEKNEQGERTYLVLKASGEPFANEQQYYDMGELFTSKNTKYILDEATGWASPILIVFTTMTSESIRGPSYWFEVPSKAFLQLSR